MATYLELFDIVSSPTIVDLRKKLRVAIIMKANAIAKSASPTLAAKEFARAALRDPQAYEDVVLRYVVADNSGATTAQIAAASDSAVQTAVNAAIDTLLGV